MCFGKKKHGHLFYKLKKKTNLCMFLHPKKSETVILHVKKSWTNVCVFLHDHKS